MRTAGGRRHQEPRGGAHDDDDVVNSDGEAAPSLKQEMFGDEQEMDIEPSLSTPVAKDDAEEASPVLQLPCPNPASRRNIVANLFFDLVAQADRNELELEQESPYGLMTSRDLPPPEPVQSEPVQPTLSSMLADKLQERSTAASHAELAYSHTHKLLGSSMGSALGDFPVLADEPFWPWDIVGKGLRNGLRNLPTESGSVAPGISRHEKLLMSRDNLYTISCQDRAQLHDLPQTLRPARHRETP